MDLFVGFQALAAIRAIAVEGRYSAFVAGQMDRVLYEDSCSCDTEGFWDYVEPADSTLVVL
jgi:hypothetical protein